mmetsp:Transcript_39220/g.92339  ORF Transcript_39220/g.92339 Transcript_39220/m.92339 type:complete len:439 (+) Transcript_39220:77-1393(+)
MSIVQHLLAQPMARQVAYICILILPAVSALKFKDLGSASMSSGMFSEQELLQLRIANRWIAEDSSIASMVDKKLPTDISKYLPSRSRKDHVAARRILAGKIHSASTSSAVGGKLATFVRDYAKIYANEFKNRMAIFFSHVSKSAGTTFCICGQTNGCVGSGMDKDKDPVLTNCHAGQDDPDSPDDGPHWGAKKQHPPAYDTCDGLTKYATKNHYTLEGNENWLIGEGVCPQFWNVVILRDPVDRLVSHMQELAKIPTKSQAAEVQTGPLYWDSESTKLTPKLIFEEIPILSNNFYIRSLLGAETYKLPFGAINKTHLEQAKRVVDGFDLVFIMHKQLLQDFGDYLGWSCENSRRIAPDDFTDNLKKRWSEDDWELVKKHNALDIELVEYAANLFKLDKLVFDHEAFKVETECGKAECGYLCKTYPLAEYINKTIVENR